MDHLQAYTINFKGLRQGEHHFQYQVDDKFFENFEETQVQEGDVQVNLIFEKRKETLFVLTFQLSGTLGLECDRCLNIIDYPVSEEFKLYIKIGEAEEPEEDDDLVMLPAETQQLNVAQYIFEYIHLIMPMRSLCESVGKDCNPEMLKILEEHEREEKTESDPRWNDLKDLLKKKNNN
ncbi:MAG: DUF177 domain-containing protein [Bacteroidia bacterium]